MILVRHTKPRGAEGRCYGWTDLPPGPDLTAEIERLDQELPPVPRILSSPLRRCTALAEALAARRALPLQVEARLAEIDFGAWEGRLWDDIPRPELDAWAADLLGARPHGGERVADLLARVRAVLAEMPPALVVTHAGVVRAALACTGAADPWEARIDYGACLRISRPAPCRSSVARSRDRRPA